MQVITREEIERSGVTTTEQLFERVPGNVNGFNTARTVGESFRPGLSSANLRGLGGGATLVLLNGRRLANYAFDGESVDLNSIPLAAIDRVEVLKDGASAIYGADAIAGVINVILRKDYQGVEIAGHVAATQHGGGNERQVQLVAGTGQLVRDGHNLFASLSYQKQQRLPANERDFSRTSYRPDLGLDALYGATFPSNIVDRPGLRIINPTAATGCSPPSSLPSRIFPFRTEACGFDAANVIDALPEVERASAMLRGTWRAASGVDVYAEALLGRNRFAAQITPMTTFPGVVQFGSPLYPANGPHYPTEFAAAAGLSGDLLLAYSVTELGPRFNTTTSDAQRYALGIEGNAAGWTFDAAAVYSANRQRLEYGGSWMYARRFNEALYTGLINPWGPSPPEGRALLESVLYRGTLQTADADTGVVSAYASRSVASLPAGPLVLALGAEARREALSYDWDAAVMNGDSPIASVQQAKARSRRVSALFGELGVPLLKGVDLQLALRSDEYSDFGSSTSPKIALRWQPLRELVLRTSWAEGFRAPPLYSLGAPSRSTLVVAGLADPVRCPVTAAATDCFFRILATTGGNPNLRPETSKQWSAGLVWEPTRTLSLGLDYWDIEMDGLIQPLEAPNVLRYYARFNDRIHRGPAEPDYPSLPGPITGMDLSMSNLGETHTSGVDLFLTWLARSAPWGQLRTALQATYVRQFDTSIDGAQSVSALGSAVYVPPIPRWRSVLTFDWSREAWGATLANLYTHGYTDQQRGPDGEPRRVREDSLWDLQVRYAGIARTLLAAGIRNLFDRDPPASNQIRTTQTGYNPQLSSPLGRTYYLRATYAFR